MAGKLEKITTLVFVVGVVLFLLYYAIRWGMLYAYPAYTVGTTQSASYNSKGFYYIHYLYYVSQRQYKGTKKRRAKESLGDRYLVKYCSVYPDWSRIYWDKPIPGTVPDFRYWSSEPFWPARLYRKDLK